MQIMGRFIESAQRRVRSIWIGRALSALLFLGLCAPHALAQTPAGTQITATADAAYDDENGNSYTASSNTVSMTVGQVAGVDIEPPRSSMADPGNTVVFPHTLDNMGNGLDSMSVAATSQMGWSVRIYEDINGNAALDAGDPLMTGPLTLAMGATANLLIAVDVPSTPTVRGTTDSIDVQVTSLYNSVEFDALIDELQIRDAGILVSLSMSFDRAS